MWCGRERGDGQIYADTLVLSDDGGLDLHVYIAGCKLRHGDETGASTNSAGTEAGRRVGIAL